jgi:hypothetical protein
MLFQPSERDRAITRFLADGIKVPLRVTHNAQNIVERAGRSSTQEVVYPSGVRFDDCKTLSSAQSSRLVAPNTKVFENLRTKEIL